jgi:Rv0078B-related antitoxin
MPQAQDDAAARLRLALDFFTTGEGLARQRLRRLHPEWTAGAIEEGISAWLRERPGAETGDGEGRPVVWTSRVA